MLVTTSSYSADVLNYYQELYRAHGALGSQLVVVPWNGGSEQDVRSLVKYIYHDLEWDPDEVVPFAAQRHHVFTFSNGISSHVPFGITGNNSRLLHPIEQTQLLHGSSTCKVF